MILVTVGTEQYPFNRLMHWIEALLSHNLIDEEVVVQYGSSTVIPSGAKVYKILKEDRFQALIHNARVVVAHCGEGTVLLLDDLDKPFVLVPRSYAFKEHVDDHQIEMALALEAVNVPIAWSPGDLLRFLIAPYKVPVTDFSETAAIALCKSLHQRFGSQSPQLQLQ